MSLLAMLKKDLRLILRDRGQLIALFLMPLAFIIPICLAFPERGYNLQDDIKRPLPVANVDVAAGAAGSETVGVHAQELLDQLSKGFRIESRPDAGWLLALGIEDSPTCVAPGPACDELFVRTLLEQGDRDVGLLIPAGFSAAIDDGQAVTATILYDPLGDAVERQMIQGVIEGNVAGLAVRNQVFSGMEQFEDMLAIAPEGVEAEVRSTISEGAESDEVVADDEESPALSVVEVQPASFRLEATPNTLQQTVPGYTVMFVFYLIGTVAAMMRLERSAGTMRRLSSAPVVRPVLVGGKLLAAIVVGLLQVAILFAVGHFVFGMGLGSSMPGLALLTLAMVVTAVAIGMLAFTLRASVALTVPLIVAALIGGCMFPSSWLPPFLRTAGRFVPHSWAVQGYQDLLVRGQGIPAILPEIGVLLVFALSAFLLALYRFDAAQES
ncbi:MAG: ABC transporter permease [Caldilineaceae bacterium]